ncbi:MAG: putative rane protein [Candidatus Eremiobacteraeota bacterium]|jgi:putative membrane protein|nr:putative rane protein [Candidatus Eremiobacteraeota bacterium]
MTSQLSRLSALCAAVVIGASAAANAATTGGATGQDTNFAVKAAQGGMAEVKLAAVAMQKSKNPTVLAFARKMNADHTKNNAQLATIAKSEGMMPPSDVGPANKALMGKLQALDGAAFDSAYLKSQVTAHQQMLALMRKEAASGSDAKLVSFAKTTAPVVQQHLTMAQADAARGGAMSGMKM